MIVKGTKQLRSFKKGVNLYIPTYRWNAFKDFYLSPTAEGSPVPTTPSKAGSAWGYYAANVNGFGYPTGIGSYFTTSSSPGGTQNLYQYSNISPLGPGYFLNNTTFNDVGGRGLPAYRDDQGWLSSLAWYETPWFPGAPGWNQGDKNFIWTQGAWLNGPETEGIGVVLSWTAPMKKKYNFSIQYTIGTQPGNDASVAIVDSLGNFPLHKKIVAEDQTEFLNFTKSYNPGDTIQFQVGTNCKVGNAVGWKIDIKSN